MPRAAKAIAVAAPMPRAAPVTIAVRCSLPPGRMFKSVGLRGLGARINPRMASVATSARQLNPIRTRRQRDDTACRGAPASDYILSLTFDYVTNLCYKICILAHEGRLPETILEMEPGVASCGCGS